MLGLLAFGGALPVAVARAGAPHVVTFEGVLTQLAPTSGAAQRFETLGAVFDELRAAGVDRLVLAGALTRPAFDPARLDAVTADLLPGLMAAMHGGDDGLLRHVIAMFEGQGFAVIGAHEVVPELTATPGLLAGPEPDAATEADMTRALAILAALGPLDVGQGAVVSGGLCLGIETLQGTDAMLRFVAATPAGLKPEGGVLVKAPKPGQDLRVDMPAIGPDTVRAAAGAGLSAIVVAAGQVLLLDRAALLTAAGDAGITLLARAI